MPPVGHVRIGASPIAVQACGATTRISRFRAHRQERLHPFVASPKRAPSLRYGRSGRWNRAIRALHRQPPRRPTICRWNVNQTVVEPFRRPLMLPWHGADAGLRTASWPSRFASPSTRCSPPNPTDTPVAHCAAMSRGSFSIFVPGHSIGRRYRGQLMPKPSRNVTIGFGHAGPCSSSSSTRHGPGSWIW